MRLGFGLRHLHIVLPSYPSLHRRHTSTMTSIVNKTVHPFDKGRLEALLNRRFFYAPAFEIYGGRLYQYQIYTDALTGFDWGDY